MNGALIQTNKLLRNFYTLCAVLNSGEAERLGVAAKAAKERITLLSNSDLEHGHTIRSRVQIAPDEAGNVPLLYSQKKERPFLNLA